MTISSTTRTAGPFYGNGVTVLFPFAFKVFQAADIFVASIEIATGIQTTLTLNVDYAVALNPNQDSFPGGAVTMLAAPATGFRIIIGSDLLNLQPTEFLNQGGFYPEVLTTALDRATILIQQLQEYLSLALQFPITDPVQNNVLPSIETRAGKVLAFDTNGNLTTVAMAAGTGLLAAQGATGAVDGVNTLFTFASSATTTPAALVFAGGIFQTLGAGADYTITFVSTGIWRITFSTAPTQAPITVALL